MLEYVVQGVVGRERVGIFTFYLKISLKLFQNGYFLDAFQHLFLSTTSRKCFDLQLLMGPFD